MGNPSTQTNQVGPPASWSSQATLIIVETRPHIATLIKEALAGARLRVVSAGAMQEIANVLAQQPELPVLLVNVGITLSQGAAVSGRYGTSGALGALQRLADDPPLWKEIASHPTLQRLPMLCYSNDGASGPPGTLIVRSPQDFQVLAQAIHNYLRLLTSIPFLPQLLREEYLPSLKGSLEEFPLSDLFQLFKLAGHSGILVLRESGRVAVLGLADGEVVHAFANHAQGSEAIYHAFDWKQAQFAFYQDLALPARTVTASTEHLVLEASRRGDESSDLREKIPSPRTLIYRAPRLTEELPNQNLSLAEMRVLAAVSRRNTVENILTRSGMSELSTLKILDALIRRGLLVIGEEVISKNTGSLRENGPSSSPASSPASRFTSSGSPSGPLNSTPSR
jgi:hypothetical protein